MIAAPRSVGHCGIVVGRTQKHPTIADRYIYSHSGRKVYEWEQSLEEVIIYIDAPTNISPPRLIVVDISTNSLRVGLGGSDRYFIDEPTFDKVKVKESSWYLDDGVITIVLAKCFQGQTWEGVLRGCYNSTLLLSSDVVGDGGNVMIESGNGGGGGYGKLLTHSSNRRCNAQCCWKDSRRKIRDLILEMPSSMEKCRIHKRLWVGWDTIIDVMQSPL